VITGVGKVAYERWIEVSTPDGGPLLVLSPRASHGQSARDTETQPPNDRPEGRDQWPTNRVPHSSASTH
jgi:hypothetical protein